MKRITTSVDPAAYAAMEDLARRDGVSTSRLVREAMERYVRDRERMLEPGPLPEWVGTLEGDGTPYAERTEMLLDELWPSELAPEPPPPKAVAKRSGTPPGDPRPAPTG